MPQRVLSRRIGGSQRRMESLISLHHEFECWIFDRYGTQLYHFSDPEGGWDGKYRGKIVSPGVYYYVIKAKGADGKEYKRSGDINIIRSKGRKGTSGGGGAVPTE